jgi:xanthine/uracil permease
VASEEPLDTEEYDKSIQGGLLSDGVCSFLAALGTGMPNTTFSQNNGGALL